MGNVRARDLGVGAGLFAFGLLLLAVLPDSRARWGPPDADSRWADVVALAVGCLGSTQRRIRPLLGLGLGLAGLLLGPLLAQAVPGGMFLVLGDLLYCAVCYGAARTSRVVMAGSITLLALAALAGLVASGPSAALQTLLSASLLLGVPVLWAQEVRQHRELADAERERAEQTRRVATLDREAAVAAERARMARDLHDVIAGQLSGIAIQSEAALTVPDARPETLRRVLTDVRRDSVAALSEMRTMIGLLRAGSGEQPDPRTAPAGLARVDALLDAARARGLRVQLDDRRPTGTRVPAAVDLAAYRVVQEALVNAAKHAPGSSVRLALRCTGDDLVVEAVNPLVPGARCGDGTGTGLLGLRERASAVGGRVEAGRVDGAWTVRAVLPAPAATPGEPR